MFLPPPKMPPRFRVGGERWREAQALARITASMRVWSQMEILAGRERKAKEGRS